MNDIFKNIRIGIVKEFFRQTDTFGIRVGVIYVYTHTHVYASIMYSSII